MSYDDEQRQRWARGALEREAADDRRRADEARSRREAEDRIEAMYKQQREQEAQTARDAERFLQQETERYADQERGRQRDEDARRWHGESMARIQNDSRDEKISKKSQTPNSANVNGTSRNGKVRITRCCMLATAFVIAAAVILSPGLVFLGLSMHAFDTTSGHGLLFSLLFSGLLFGAVAALVKNLRKSLLIYVCIAVVSSGFIFWVRSSSRPFFNTVVERYR
jgi:hypothetical protein